MSQKQKNSSNHFYFSNLVQTHIIQKKGKKTVLKENWFFRTKQEKFILYKRGKKNDFEPKNDFFFV